MKRARNFIIAGTKEEVLDKLFGKKILSRDQLEAAYEIAEQTDQHGGNPKTAWGMANGITRLSQQTPFADKRNQIDRAASKVLSMAF